MPQSGEDEFADILSDAAAVSEEIEFLPPLTVDPDQEPGDPLPGGGEIRRTSSLSR